MDQPPFLFFNPIKKILGSQRIQRTHQLNQVKKNEPMARQ